MEIEDKLNPIVMKITDILQEEELSHWEIMLILEMIKQSCFTLWLGKVVADIRREDEEKELGGNKK